jgi:ABC-type transport system involved in cytochrome bd biosynthesis fused ATPase/permease subunit
VTGASGVGKTTLLQTLVGWRRARSGDVWRTSAPIGYVGVDGALVSGTLRENLSLAVTRRDEDLFARLSALGLDGARFADLDAPLYEDGRGLSTGERVRVLLARALVAEAPLLVLDDVAGVLDEESRDVVRRVLSNLEGVAIVEATVDTPILFDVNQRIDLAW